MEKEKKKTILIGMTGGIDSAIAAYLLKRQGHNVIGIGIVFAEQEEEDTGPVKNRNLSKEKKDSIIGAEEEKEEVIPFMGVYLIQDLEKVKETCNNLDIPFYAVNAQKEYKSELSEYIIAAKIGGYNFTPELFCTTIIVNTLISKMSVLKADCVATGHYAKIIKNQSTNEHNIYVANELKFDQSYYLSRLEEKSLKHLILPLSEMRRAEVEKIANMLNLEVDRENINKEGFMDDPMLASFVAKNVASSFITEGNVINYISENILGEHTGVHNFYRGSDNIKLKNNVAEKGQVVVSIDYKSGTVQVLGKDDLVPITHCLLSRCVYDDSADISKPFEGFIKFGISDKKQPVTIIFKNNHKIFIEFKEKQKRFIFSGEYGVLYTRKGVGGKIIGGGLVSKAGHLNEEMKLTFLPSLEDDLHDDDKEKEVKDIYALKF